MVAYKNPKLVIQSGPMVGEALLIDGPEVVIGRETGVTWVIDSPGVSRRHARLFFRQDLVILEDLNSSNGTFINGERLTQPLALKPGDQIGLGRMVVLVFLAERSSVDATRLETGPSVTQMESGPGATRLEEAPARPAQWPTPPPAPAYPPPAYESHAPAELSPQEQLGATMIGGMDTLMGRSAQPCQLVVSVAGQPARTIPLTQPRLTIGRADDNQIVVDSRIVSRHHAVLDAIPGGYRFTPLPEASNPVLMEGRPLLDPIILQHGNVLRIGSLDPGLMVSMTFQDPSNVMAKEAQPIHFGAKTLIQLGRDPNNDVVLPSPGVSRMHAQIERVGQRYRLRDLRSANGTFVNDQRIDARDIWLQPNDVIRIGPHRFVMGQDALSQFDETKGLRVDAMGLNKWVRKDLNILQNISLAFQPREFIVVVGQSGGGKSTLLDAIAGYRPATQGTVLVNETDIYQNFDVIRNDIGYVPQRDIIHTELTVFQALDYAARLRMPQDTTKEERHKRVAEVLDDLDLAHRKDSPIHKLSGGQIKRVSIGVELLNKPGLFFLDEPTSGLDPGTETAFMHLCRRLADQGRTIVLVTHATKNVMLADKVVFLARGGYLAWFGPPDEALQYFDEYRTERERRSREMEFDQIYAILDDSSKGSAKEWAKRYQEHAAYQKYIIQPLQEGQGTGPSPVRIDSTGMVSTAKVAQGSVRQAAPKPKRTARVSGLYQFIVLSLRNIRILSRDRTSLMLMLFVPWIVSALDLIIAPLMGKTPYEFMTGDPHNGAITLFLVTIYALLVSGLSQMREFVKEKEIYKRERLVNLKIFPYVISKIWVALLLAFWQGLAYTVMHYLAYKMPGGVTEFSMFYVTMVLAVFSGMMAGLLASAMAPAASSAPMLIIMLLIPQIVLSGILAPVPKTVSWIASTRWAFQSMIGITGMGSDVAKDACWQLPDDLRNSMSLDDKAYFGCNCMGAAIFTPGSCDFPGAGAYFAEELSTAAPQEPADLPDEPAEPVLPPVPEAPADKNDQIAMVEYMNSLDAYNKQAQLIQDQYRAEIDLYRAQADVYEAQMKDYQQKRVEYEGARNKAVQSAEGVIESMVDQFGWAFVNKEDTEGYLSWMIQTWAFQFALTGVYFVVILVLIKRKDVA